MSVTWHSSRTPVQPATTRLSPPGSCLEAQTRRVRRHGTPVQSLEMTSLVVHTARRVAARAGRPFISLPSLSRVEHTFEQRRVVPFSRQQARDGDRVVVWWHRSR